MHHGFFEVLQGNHPTPDWVIHSIGPAQQQWVHGTDDAFTFIPNYLVTGIYSMLISLGIIAWSVRFLHMRNGHWVLLAFFVLLTLGGGGIGYIPFFLTVCLFAGSIRSDLGFWSKRISEAGRKVMKNWWRTTLMLSVVFFIAGLEVSVFGVFPGLSNPDSILYACWALLGLSLLSIYVTYVSGLASDLATQRA